MHFDCNFYLLHAKNVILNDFLKERREGEKEKDLRLFRGKHYFSRFL